MPLIDCPTKSGRQGSTPHFAPTATTSMTRATTAAGSPGAPRRRTEGTEGPSARHHEREWSRDFLRTALCCTLPTPVAMASASASATMAFSGASQLGGTFHASQIEGSSPKRHAVQLRIGSFNVGIEQSHGCRRCLSASRHSISCCNGLQFAVDLSVSLSGSRRCLSAYRR